MNIVCIGEILWDSMPSGLFLGGAPFNVAYHLTRLGNHVTFISRVGDDRLGMEAIKRVKKAGLSTACIQIDPELNTGFVDVVLGKDGIPDYHILKPVAWDKIALTTDVEQALESTDAIVFGTLAQRSETSRKTIKWIESSNAIKVLDLNFRFPFVDDNIVAKSMELADIVKMNDDEMAVLQDWYNLSPDIENSLKNIAEQFSLKGVCLTQGSKGAVLWNKEALFESEGFKVDVNDTVGSGDAFLAAFISGHLLNTPSHQLLSLSNRLGAFVATRSGGTPGYSLGSYEEISTLTLPGYQNSEHIPD